jgi:hypothetical protein
MVDLRGLKGATGLAQPGAGGVGGVAQRVDVANRVAARLRRFDGLRNFLQLGFEMGNGAFQAFQPRALGVYLLRHLGVAAARLGDVAVELAHPFAQVSLVLGGRFGDIGDMLIRRIGVRIGAVGLGNADFQFAQAVALFEPRRSGRTGLRVGDEAIPAPQIAVAVDQTLAGLQLRRQARAGVGVVDEADLGQTAGKRAGLGDKVGHRAGALG